MRENHSILLAVKSCFYFVSAIHTAHIFSLFLKTIIISDIKDQYITHFVKSKKIQKNKIKKIRFSLSAVHTFCLC